jgi:hypothetical protein
MKIIATLRCILSLSKGEASLRVAELIFQKADDLRSMVRNNETLAGFRGAITLFEAQGAIASANRGHSKPRLFAGNPGHADAGYSSN